ncbi:hypothetical protein AWH48_16930 [Domibacillus aminovorans]|uniref:ImmA/IrrE family metallo-endopeptidase n=1 Tax=Domibacillus aminovorans TaxID=29332 RepID=A0A177L1N2_9BACI|nr:LPD25 domain-containing protein [Domibacillus aminovorans]OAH58681.1 hypothetical protein AWH48_16930 [Domibacillus aminovorans]
MVKYKKKDPEEKKKEVEALTKSMEDNINGYFQTEKQLKEYLSFMSKFYNFSANNTTLIQRQFSGAEAVGSFKFWKDHGFSVQKGEKGIKILVPIQTQPSFKDKEGNWKTLKEATEEEKKKINSGKIKLSQGRVYFSIGHVFDISQTNATAKDLPTIFPNKWLEGEVKDFDILYKGMEQIANNNGILIIEPINELGVAKGVSYTDLKAVALNPRNSQLQNVKTLIHELAHAKLHTPETADKYTAPEKEFQAEMTAYTVSSYFGIDTSEYSLSYLANWTQGKDLRDKSQLLKEVHETTVEFINTIEEVIQQEQESKKENIAVNEMNIDAKKLENESLALFLVKYEHLSHTTEQLITVDELQKEIRKEGSSYRPMDVENMDVATFLKEFNELNKERYAVIPEKDIKGPTVLIQWSENDELKSNEVMSFGEANEKMTNLSEKLEDRGGYDKTRYHVIFPKELSEKNQLSIINMDRLDLGDGFYKSPLEQIYSEQNLSEAVLDSLKKEIAPFSEVNKGKENGQENKFQDIDPLVTVAKKGGSKINKVNKEPELSM